METLLWTALVLAFAYLWLRGHWFGWLVVWFCSFFLYQFVANSPSDPAGTIPVRASVIGIITAVPMLIRLFMALRAAGLKTVDDLYCQALADPELARRLISKFAASSDPNRSSAPTPDKPKPRIEPHF